MRLLPSSLALCAGIGASAHAQACGSGGGSTVCLSVGGAPCALISALYGH